MCLNTEQDARHFFVGRFCGHLDDLCVRAFVYMCGCSSAFLYMCLSVCLSVFLNVSVCLSACVSVYMYVSVCLSVRMYVISIVYFILKDRRALVTVIGE